MSPPRAKESCFHALHRRRWLHVPATAARFTEKALALLGNHLYAMSESEGAGSVASPSRKMRLDSGKAMFWPEHLENSQRVTVQFPTSSHSVLPFDNSRQTVSWLPSAYRTARL